MKYILSSQLTIIAFMNAPAFANVYSEIKGFPETAVGKVILPNENYHHCTGALVGPDLMLTAAPNCLYDSQGNLKPNIKFAPPLKYPDIAENAPVLVSVSHVWHGSKTPQNLKETTHQYGLVRLNSPLGEKFGYFKVKNYSSAIDLVNSGAMETCKFFGYNVTSGNREGRYLLSGSCHSPKFFYQTPWGSALFTHSAESTPGGAGGPITITENGELKLVGFASALSDTEQLPGVLDTQVIKKINELNNNELGKPESTIVYLCNNSTSPVIHVALMYFDKDNQYNTVGWYPVKKGQCREHSLGHKTTGEIETFAHGQHHTWKGNDGSYCVSNDLKSKFKIHPRSACDGNNMQKAKFKKTRVDYQKFNRIVYE